MLLPIVSFATQPVKLTNKDLAGDWKYVVETNDAILTGLIKFTVNQDKLEGTVHDDQGNVFDLFNIVIEDDELRFELQPEAEVIKVKARLVESKLVGTVAMQGGEFKLTAEKNS